ncbi:MAG: glycosyltransferase [Nanoarchaeota archaeon]|nr:glycosyltransferase [Nanoarchaeota archaeon]
MKVCMLTTSFPSHKGHHQSPFILSLAQALARNKTRVDVVCPFYHQGKEKEEVIDKVQVHRFQYLYPASLQGLHKGGGLPHNLSRSHISKLELMPYLMVYFLKSIKYARKADVIHAQWSLSGLVGVYLKKMFKKPLIISTRGIAVQYASKSKWMKPILKNVLKNADYITPNNQHHVDIIQKLGVPKSKIISVPNGVDTKLYKPRTNIRKNLHIPKKAKVILFVGWLIERKGVMDLVKAFTLIHKQHPDAVLYLIGQGSLKNKIKATMKKEGLQRNVKMIDSVSPERVAQFMSAADLFVLPSLAEGRPNVIYEAMLSQLPVIATNIPGTNELIQNNKNGILVPPKKPDAIAKAAVDLLANTKKATTLAKVARKNTLKQKVSWDDCAKKFIKIYKEAVCAQ